MSQRQHLLPDSTWSPLGDVGLGISDAHDLDHSHSDSRLDSPELRYPESSKRSDSPDPKDPDPDHDLYHIRCPTQQSVQQRRLSWVPLTILVLAVYATILSGIYLVIALVRPRYGHAIGEDKGLAPSTATLLSALFAKTIELSYVTVCVAFLGQVLSRRALTQGSRGITISDMSMRSWIMQPGALIVHWETLRYSAATVLGAITLTATVVAMLYTTAAEALVSPKLRMSPLHSRSLSTDVYTSFGNSTYLAYNCPAIIDLDRDPDNRNTTCLDMQHVGEAYHNYQLYLNLWRERRNTSYPNEQQRPLPIGSLYDNTTLTGSWIEHWDLADNSKHHGRLVDNVTAVMPHGSMLTVSRYPANELPPPHSVSGEGSFELEASVLSPAVNVLCVGMTAHELAPLVFNEWPETKGKFNASHWPGKPENTPKEVPVYPDWLNRTVVDDFFFWGPDYGLDQRPPIFGKLPKPYNTLLNGTGNYPTQSIYLLGATPDDVHDPPYVLCGLRAKLTPRCSTRYNATANGAQLSTRCEDPNNPLQLDNAFPDAPDAAWEPDWKNVASEWATSLSLGTGITDGQSSNARLLMQLVPEKRRRDPLLPSLAEALAVMAGSALVLGSRGSPVQPGDAAASMGLQSFEARVRSIGYASGGTQRWQGIFYVILVFAFLTSAICLAFILFEVRGRQVTDFTDPQNLFTLAMNSPATPRLQGACGAGPQGRQLNERWVVAMEEQDEHYYLRPPGEAPRRRVKSMASMEVEDPKVSPAIDEYHKLSTQRSFLSRFY